MSNTKQTASKKALAAYHDAKKHIKKKYPEALVPLTEDEQARMKTIYRLTHKLRQQGTVDYHVDHCFPLACGGVHHPDNLMILPASLNLSKNKHVDLKDPAQLQGLRVSMAYWKYDQPKRQCDRLLIGYLDKLFNEWMSLNGQASSV